MLFSISKISNIILILKVELIKFYIISGKYFVWLISSDENSMQIYDERNLKIRKNIGFAKNYVDRDKGLNIHIHFWSVTSYYMNIT